MQKYILIFTLIFANFSVVASEKVGDFIGLEDGRPRQIESKLSKLCTCLFSLCSLQRPSAAEEERRKREQEDCRKHLSQFFLEEPVLSGGATIDTGDKRTTRR